MNQACQFRDIQRSKECAQESQDVSRCLKMSQDVSRCLKMSQDVSRLLVPNGIHFLQRQNVSIEGLNLLATQLEPARVLELAGHPGKMSSHPKQHNLIQGESAVWKMSATFSLVSRSPLHSMGKCDPRSACATVSMHPKAACDCSCYTGLTKQTAPQILLSTQQFWYSSLMRKLQ